MFKFLVFRASGDGITLNEYNSEEELIAAIDFLETQLPQDGKMHFSSSLDSFEPKTNNDSHILILKGEILVPERVVHTVGFKSVG